MNPVELSVARNDPRGTLGDRILKVDPAGEHGAVSIYTGQILMARWRAPDLCGELAEFRAHELGHRAISGAELAQRSVRRCRSYVLCGRGGLMLGLITGLCGRSAIAATTVALERVVLRHLEHQLEVLREADPVAARPIASIVAEERAHHDRSLLHVRAGSVWPRLLDPIVSASTEAVIRLGMKL
jgi:3-demethoxyubiquinol 3-hydroxylase